MADNSHGNYGRGSAGQYIMIVALVVVIALFLLFSVPLAIGVLTGAD